MSGMCMVELYIRKVREISIIAATCFIATGCNWEAMPSSNIRCDSSPREIFHAVLSDDELLRLSGGYFKDRKSLPVVWDDAPAKKKECENEISELVLTKSSELRVGKEGRYILASKVYFDDEAAFVELIFLPTGMQGDFFLRNEGGWKVTQRNIWESK